MIDPFLQDIDYLPRAFIGTDISAENPGWVDLRSLTKPFEGNVLADLVEYHGISEVVVSYVPAHKKWIYYEDLEDYELHVNYSMSDFQRVFRTLVGRSNSFADYEYVVENYESDNKIVLTEYFEFDWSMVTSNKPDPKAKHISKSIEKEKEPKKMTLLDKLKTSSFSAAKTAASTTLAEKITDLVLDKLPAPARAIADKLPRYILVVIISSAVHMAAERFDIPGKLRVKEISAYAIDGALYEFSKGIMKSLIPIFDAIRNMAPEDLTRLEEEATK